jgi:hypothetical protein
MASGGFSISLGASFSNQERFYVLGILNSKLLFWRLRRLSNKFSGGWITCTKQFVTRLSIPTTESHDKENITRRTTVAECSERLAVAYASLRDSHSKADESLAQRIIVETERQIDDAVYGLCQLSDAEIRMVETASAKIGRQTDAPGDAADEDE